MQKRSFKTGVFLSGFLTGIVVTALIVVLLAGYFVRHPQKVMVKVVDMGMSRVVEKTVQTIPRDHIGQRQDEITESAERFAKAFSENRVSTEEINSLASAVFTIMADQQITSLEIDHLLDLINQYAE